MKKALLFGTFLMVAGALAPFANAQVGNDVSKTKEILFKIHDVRPNKDSDGMVKDCSFLVTFYNRTDYAVDSASLDFSWVDDTGNYVIEQNEKEIASKLSSASLEKEKKEEESYNDEDEGPKLKAEKKNINAFVDMPSLDAYTQTTIAGNLQSEKCFLLQEDVKFKVTSCKLKNTSASGDNKTYSNTTQGRSIESCSRLFKYVSPQNPEYYREFKAISVADQQKILESDLQKSLNAIDAKYNNVVSNIDEAKGILADIK